MKYAVFAICALCACDRQLNPEYCLAHPEDLRCGPAVDGPLPCADDGDCPGQVCDIAAAEPVCVDCTVTNATLCDATSPVCSGNQCRACAADDDCAAGVCLPDGSCPTAESIVYVSTTGSTMGGCGTLADPCAITQALNEASPTRSILKLLPNAVQDYTVSGGSGLTIGKDVTIAARGATIRKTSSGPVILMSGVNRVLTILGGVVKGGLTTGGHGVLCAMNGVLTLVETDVGGNEGNGIDDTSCGLILDRVTIHNNDKIGIAKDQGVLSILRSTIHNNLEGGIEIVGNGTQFTIINNVFWTNGTAGVTFGGVSIVTDTSTTSRLELNSFNANLSSVIFGAAVHCIVGGFTARNNVMFGNGIGDQVTGTCNHVHSIATPGTLPPGVGNLAVDPMFFDAAIGNLHTQPGSPTEGAGDPATDLTRAAAVDFDGDPRTSPPDIGIDEHP